MLPELDQLPEDHRSGFIAVVGRPNVGKSTLFNRILEQKIAITSPKPQTTRDQLMGIYTTDNVQMIFLDTPGIHKAVHKLGHYMMQVVEKTIRDADIVLWLVDANVPPKPEDRHIANLLAEIHQRNRIDQIVIGMNKIDQLARSHLQRQDGFASEAAASDAKVAARQAEYLSLLGWFSTTAEENAQIALFSALTGEGVNELVAQLRGLLPRGPRYYPEEQVTDLQVRFLVEELIREKALGLLQKEVPHSMAVTIDEFSQRNKNMTYISAVLYVERDSQKKIVLGRKGEMIKKIGQAARPEIEDLIETKVYLDLWVKVWEKWRKKSGLLRQLGYAEG